MKELAMEGDPTILMVDMLLRVFALEIVRLIPWIGVVYLHARWSRSK